MCRRWSWPHDPVDHDTSGERELMRLLFLGTSEEEVPLFRAIGRILQQEPDAEAAVYTSLHRLAVDGATLAPLGTAADEELAARIYADHGLPDPAYAAHYDGDWYMASWAAKRHHALRCLASMLKVFDHERPDWFISSVGGCTFRVAGEAIARHRGIPTAFFNLIPLPGRHVILPDMEAPFIPWGASLHDEPDHVDPVPLDLPPMQTPPQPGLTLQRAAEGVQRVMGHLTHRAYPLLWPVRRATTLATWSARSSLYGRLLADSGDAGSASLRILYPLHDERDFQVAMRERHAIPQVGLLTYLASRLPERAVLQVKLHPSHIGALPYGQLRTLRELPNVVVLPPNCTAKEAIDQSSVVLTLASSMGFEALLAGKPVVCYGQPFYGRRGLTVDIADPRELIDALVAAAGHPPTPGAVAELVELVRQESFRGQFHPIPRDPVNIGLLANSLMGYVRSDGSRR
jgi:hypothetical protein